MVYIVYDECNTADLCLERLSYQLADMTGGIPAISAILSCSVFPAISPSLSLPSYVNLII